MIRYTSVFETKDTDGDSEDGRAFYFGRTYGTIEDERIDALGWLEEGQMTHVTTELPKIVSDGWRDHLVDECWENSRGDKVWIFHWTDEE